MNYKLKKTITNVRVIIAVLFLIFAIVAINPAISTKGVAIRSVEFNSSANIAGIKSPEPGVSLRSREVILSLDNNPINSLEEYYVFLEDLELDTTIAVRTNKQNYVLRTKPLVEIEFLNETEEVVVEEIIKKELENGSIVNETIEKTITVQKTIEHVVGVEDLGLKVYRTPTNNIRKGLDLQGGTRVLLQPQERLNKDDLDSLLSSMKERLNIFGLSDVVIRDAGDLSGNQFIVVEIAGANEQEVKELLAKQGKFEAKIKNETVFFGGKKDVTYVCRTAECSGIDPQAGCGYTGSAWQCRFRFSISLSPDAANRQANLTSGLNVVTENNDQYLSEPLLLFLDDKEVDSLNIGAELKGRAVTDIQISGSGLGGTQQEAIADSLKNMKRLQTILITGSLPVKLSIVKTDLVSPILGEEFLKNAIFIGFFALFGVCLVVFLRYRKWQIALPMAFTMILEVVILLGVASLIGWNLDLAAIAGIIIVIGTGVDHQIVIADETLRGETQGYDWKRRMKNAFFIIIAAYITTLVAMIPLLFAGAGLLKGFALTTIIGITIGVFITRPAYAKVVEILLRD